MTMRGVVLTMALALVGASGMNRFGIDFLQENKFKEGVVMLPSGLQYKILRKGEGTDHPTESSPCECHYEGRTAANYPDGAVFDSSYARGQPTTFAPNQVIGGWTEAMQLMVEGDKWELFIPSDLAYGDRGRPPKIGGGDCLVFTIEIINIKGARVAAKKRADEL
jgi:FKBP-type peptidyl-prolyl cis-trans isomerase FklB